jgi:chaperonin GroEL (HSP60 family)
MTAETTTNVELLNQAIYTLEQQKDQWKDSALVAEARINTARQVLRILPAELEYVADMVNKALDGVS